MAVTDSIAASPIARNGRDVGFAIGIIIILAVLFLPIPAFLIAVGLAFSIALSVLILMVALWIQRPLDFSSVPAVLLVTTMLRLSLNIATTRMILSEGNIGTHAAGYVISGFSQLVMSGDFAIGARRRVALRRRGSGRLVAEPRPGCHRRGARIHRRRRQFGGCHGGP